MNKFLVLVCALVVSGCNFHSNESALVGPTGIYAVFKGTYNKGNCEIIADIINNQSESIFFCTEL